MTFEAYKKSLEKKEMPPGLSPELNALWYEGVGDWDTAHQTVQHEPGEDAALVHAYLHRKEGDAGNAAYWYEKADREPADISFNAEYDEILRYLLDKISFCMTDF